MKTASTFIKVLCAVRIWSPIV